MRTQCLCRCGSCRGQFRAACAPCAASAAQHGKLRVVEGRPIVLRLLLACLLLVLLPVALPLRLPLRLPT